MPVLSIRDRKNKIEVFYEIERMRAGDVRMVEEIPYLTFHRPELVQLKELWEPYGGFEGFLQRLEEITNWEK